jgi:DHA2 family multidrug resistance protein
MPQGDITDPSISALQRALILITVTLVTLLYAMTVTIANVALPQMQGALAATQDQIAWVVTFNIVATAIVTPMAGWLTGRFGRRRLIIGSLIGFALASLLCGLATSLEALVIYRIAQGAFGAPLVPVSQAIVLDTYPKRVHGVVTAIFGMGVVTGPIVGPVLGGYLSEAYNWRWVFFMIVPFTAVAFIGVWIFIRDTKRLQSVRLDWTGFLMLSLAVGTFQLILDRGERANWFDSAEILIYAGLALIGLYIFIVHTLTTKQPFLNPQLLRDRNFVIGLFIVLVFGLLNFTPMTLLPALLQNLRGYPDSIIGFLLGMRGLGTLVGFAVLFFANRLDPRLMLILGFTCQAWAGWEMAQFDLNLTTWDVAWTSWLQGLGVGLLWVPVTLVTFATLDARYISDGMGIFHLLRNIGSSIFISLSVALVIRSAKINYADMTTYINPYNEAFAMEGVSGAWTIDNTAGLAALSGEISRQAAMIGYVNSFYLFTWTSLAVIPLILLIRWKR